MTIWCEIEERVADLFTYLLADISRVTFATDNLCFLAGFRLYKWKGPQELQPATNSQFLAAHRRIQASTPSESSDNIKNIFATLARVITDVSQNTPAQRRMSKSVRGERNTPASRGDNVRSRTRYLTTIDKVEERISGLKFFSKGIKLD